MNVVVRIAFPTEALTSTIALIRSVVGKMIIERAKVTKNIAVTSEVRSAISMSSPFP